MKVYNLYSLNKYQNSKTLNDIRFADSKIVKGMGKEAVMYNKHTFVNFVSCSLIYIKKIYFSSAS
jgi:hypothetical protein